MILILLADLALLLRLCARGVSKTKPRVSEQGGEYAKIQPPKDHSNFGTCEDLILYRSECPFATLGVSILEPLVLWTKPN